jgi:RimJ/RimL family protein N-acetyltransferase
MEISFRPLADDDMPLMHRWLSAEHVAEWYPVEDVRKPPAELVRKHYLPMISGEEPTRPFVFLEGGRPVGYIQTYMIRDHPAYARQVQVGDGAAGVDMFIGEEDAVHRGLGPEVLRAFVAEVVFGEMRAASCIIGPQPENRSAIRAYEKAGFYHLKTVMVTGPSDAGEEYLMVRRRW